VQGAIAAEKFKPRRPGTHHIKPWSRSTAAEHPSTINTNTPIPARGEQPAARLQQSHGTDPPHRHQSRGPTAPWIPELPISHTAIGAPSGPWPLISVRAERSFRAPNRRRKDMGSSGVAGLGLELRLGFVRPHTLLPPSPHPLRLLLPPPPPPQP
jgi:hypothetical protein